MINIRKVIQDELYKYFVNNDHKEWVNVDRININRIDVDIVTDINEPLKKSKEYIQHIIDNINKEQVDSEKIYLGFCNIYSIEKAEMFKVKKPKIKNIVSESSFSDIIDNNENNSDDNSEKITKAKIISFYSYKGGVGRTVALIQVANLLAQKGKKVALIDMDIEAPSFNEIFKNDIQFEDGLVKYLYNKVHNLEEINVGTILSKLTLDVSGEVYVMPAGSINKKYIKMIEGLKQKRISENEYIKGLIDKLNSDYGIEYVLIDSRTGINNWGALSIGAIADEVMLMAYPNEENVEGTNLILDILNDRKKCTVIFSRIDGTEQGIKKAKYLFDKINTEQQFIGIQYDSAIAVASKFPIDSISNQYVNISNFILQDEINKRNSKWIKENKEKVMDVLNNIQGEKNFSEIITNDEAKFIDKSNYFVIKNLGLKLDSVINTERNEILQLDLFENNNKLNEIRTKQQDNLENELVDVCVTFFMNIKKYLDKVQIFDDEFCEMFSKYKSIGIEQLEKYISECKKTIYDYVSKFKAKNIIFIVDFKKIDNYLQSNYKFDNDLTCRLLGIALGMVNQNDKIQLKVLFEDNNFLKYEEILKKHKANILDLSWSKLNKDALDSRIKEIFDKVTRCANGLSIESSSLQDSLVATDEILYNMLPNDFVSSDLLYCKRVDESKYSMEFINWFVNNITYKKILSKAQVLDVIKLSAKIERENKIEDKSSIITFKSFEKAISQYNN